MDSSHTSSWSCAADSGQPRHRTAAAGAALALLTLLPLAGCGGERPANVLLITVDTLRADRLSSYGYTESQTPHIDVLAGRGVLFERAFCDVTWTTPSMASTFTGTYATRHGLQSSHQRLAETTTLAGLLRARGLHTAAVIGSFPVDSTFGLAQGFDLFDEHFDQSIVRDAEIAGLDGALPEGTSETARSLWSLLDRMDRAYRSDAEVADRAVRWLGEERETPFFLWVHFFGPHEKMYLNLSFEDLLRRNMADYDADLRVTDAQVGRVLEALRSAGLEESTLVVFHADHGQNLFEAHLDSRPYIGHGRDLHEPTLRIPFIVAGPGVLGGERSNAFARNVDLLPTVLDLLGDPSPDGLDGRSLKWPLRHPWLARLWGYSKGETYAETYLSATGIFAVHAQEEERGWRFGFVHRGVRTERYKYVESEPVPLLEELSPAPLPPALVERERRRALYDLHADPFESRDATADQPEVAKRLRARLRHYTAGAQPAPTAVLEPAARERLRALGYVE
jgi:arylsulfatase A-like enzyme